MSLCSFSLYSLLLLCSLVLPFSLYSLLLICSLVLPFSLYSLLLLFLPVPFFYFPCCFSAYLLLSLYSLLLLYPLFLPSLYTPCCCYVLLFFTSFYIPCCCSVFLFLSSLYYLLLLCLIIPPFIFPVAAMFFCSPLHFIFPAATLSSWSSFLYSCFPKILLITIFVIIIYIPYTCLRVCYKHMLCFMYDFFSATTRKIYLVIVSNQIDCSLRFFCIKY